MTFFSTREMKKYIYFIHEGLDVGSSKSVVNKILDN